MTDLGRHKRDWEQLAETDPLWAVLTDPSRKGGRWTREEFLETGEHQVADLLARAAALGRPAAHRRAFDFGCGAGRLTRALAARFDEAVGVDVAEGMVEVARQLNADVPNCTSRSTTVPTWSAGSPARSTSSTPTSSSSTCRRGRSSAATSPSCCG